jgi:2-(1,2-epoxy-1,2-dihydrophenyl)acetyl-CoA isomerase
MTETLLSSRRDGVTTFTINRPAVRNAVDAPTMIALREGIAACETDGTRVIVITGAGGSFSSGTDISVALQPGANPDLAYGILTEAYGPTLLAIRDSSWPVIAAVDGMAAGLGCDIALACDLRLVPDGGGTWTLPRIVGLGRAYELMWSGRTVDAEEALRIGLANQRFAVETFAEEVQSYAARLAQQAPLALTRGKRAMQADQEGSFAESLQREAAYQREIFASEDGWEGFRAFAEKRKPQWKGK